MKKIFAIAILSLIIFSAVLKPEASNAQSFVRVVQGTAADTLKASTTYLTSSTNLNFSTTQNVSTEVYIDTANGGSGTPSGKMTIQNSVDGIHWNDTGDTLTFAQATPVTKIFNDNPFVGAFIRLKIVTTSTAQKSRYWFAIKSSNRY